MSAGQPVSNTFNLVRLKMNLSSKCFQLILLCIWGFSQSALAQNDLSGLVERLNARSTNAYDEILRMLPPSPIGAFRVDPKALHGYPSAGDEYFVPQRSSECPRFDIVALSSFNNTHALNVNGRTLGHLRGFNIDGMPGAAGALARGQVALMPRLDDENPRSTTFPCGSGPVPWQIDNVKKQLTIGSSLVGSFSSFSLAGDLQQKRFRERNRFTKLTQNQILMTVSSDDGDSDVKDTVTEKVVEAFARGGTAAGAFVGVILTPSRIGCQEMNCPK